MFAPALILPNAELPIVVTELGIITVSNLAEPQNAPPSMVVTPLGIVIEVKSSQSLKALSLIVVRLLGRDTLAVLLDLKAFAPTVVTPSLTGTEDMIGATLLVFLVAWR